MQSQHVNMITSERKIKNILIAEDNNVIGQTLMQYFNKLGYYCQWVNNGKKAYDLLSNLEQFDLLITDLRMPEIDGKNLIKLVRNDMINIHIIVMSNSIQDISSEEYENYQITKVIDKCKMSIVELDSIISSLVTYMMF